MSLRHPTDWGLRKYAGLPDSIWGNVDHCQHEWVNRIAAVGRNDTKEMYRHAESLAMADAKTGSCSRCGAWRGQYGLEPTVDMYVHHTVEILREVRRVLRKDGVCFWNIGDSYATGAGSGRIMGGKVYGKQNPLLESGDIPECQPNRMPQPGLKPKDLCLIPFRVALAAQADGWWVRSVIIWSKPNPMPESVTDRPTESHEYIIMLTKSARYFWDAEAVREPESETSGGWQTRAKLGLPHHKTTYGTDVDSAFSGELRHHNDGLDAPVSTGGRNLRSVWDFPTQPYKEAHFATFPEALPERCIKAASREGDLVLDPFAGSGTTLWVAKKLGRRSVGYELSEEYCRLIIERNRQDALPLEVR